MKNFQYVLPLFACLFILNACQKEEDPILAQNDSGIKTTEQAIVGWKDCQDFQNYDLTVCFADATDDRCRCDYTCTWSGAVTYTLNVRTKDQEKTITLEPPGNSNHAASSVLLGKTRISIEEVQPIPCNEYRNFEIYELRITVSEEGLGDANNQGVRLLSDKTLL